MKVLVVEDNPGMRRMLERTLLKNGYDVVATGNGDHAIDKVQNETFFAVISDLKLPGADGISVLREARKADERTITIIITAFGSVEIAVQAMKEGADDFLTKPFDTNLLLVQLQKGHHRYQLVNENTLLRQEIEDQTGFPEIIGKNKLFLESLNLVRKVGKTDSTVLLLGESGTGKELFARETHNVSSRKHKQLVAINCAAIPLELLENELFGHERGAYTGADRRKPGKLELADGGTVFLDEIGDMNPVLQAKLLRFIQEKQFERVGGNATLTVNVRVIAATNQDLRELVREGLFREDLFYRLSVFPVVIPPLRNRLDDIPLLVDYFIHKFEKEFRKKLTILPETMERLSSYEWPGNVRELQNCLERAAILSLDGLIKPEHVAVESIREAQEFDLDGILLGRSMQEAVDYMRRIVEQRMISETLKSCGWNKSLAAKELQVNYKTLLTKMKQYEID